MPKGFYRDPTLKFDVAKMQSALAEVDSRVARQSPLGERDINAICLTQIPNDPNSITGGNVRGLYWTKPDSTYQEVQREEVIDEVQYSEFVKLFEDTYFKEMYDLNMKYGFSELSMGMSSDYISAIDNGATYIRVGSKIFGERSR